MGMVGQELVRKNGEGEGQTGVGEEECENVGRVRQE